MVLGAFQLNLRTTVLFGTLQHIIPFTFVHFAHNFTTTASNKISDHCWSETLTV